MRRPRRLCRKLRMFEPQLRSALYDVLLASNSKEIYCYVKVPEKTMMQYPQNPHRLRSRRVYQLAANPLQISAMGYRVRRGEVCAFGRSLADFRVKGVTTPNNLYPAEEKLLDCAGRGELCKIGDELPGAASDEKLVRPGFLRFLLLGGDNSAPVHEKGVQLQGAFLDGDIDLDGADHLRPINLIKCRIQGQFRGQNAVFSDVSLRGCHVQGIFCSEAEIKGNVILGYGFVSHGEVNFSGAKIIGELEFSQGHFKNPSDVALRCDNAKIGGNVLLMCHAEGKVRLCRCKIEGNVDCRGGSFEVNLIRERFNKDEARAAYALDLFFAIIKGELWFGPGPTRNQHAFVKGSINLQSATVTVLIDSEQSWPPKQITINGNKVSCSIELDGFTYQRFAVNSPTDYKRRRKWLLRQRSSYINEGFRPQPFQQLINVLRAMGHDADARRIALFKESLLSPIRVRRARRAYRPFVWLTGKAWGLSCGYGYRPHRLIIGLIALWLACGVLYQLGADHRGFAPRDAQVWTNPDYNSACGSNWTACQGGGQGGKVNEIIAFNALAYSADTLLPVIDLGQRSAWTPMWKEIKVEFPYWELTVPAGAVRVAAWAENILGVAGVILIGAILSGIVKRD